MRIMTRIKDVAEHAGVSISSVSRYLNNPEALKGPTRTKVQKAVEELGYSPSPIARSLRTKTTNTIAFIIPTITNLYYIDVFNILQREALAKGYALNLLATNSDPQVLRKYLRDLPMQNIDGIIIAFLDEDEVIEDIHLVQRQVPVVMITSTPHRQEFDSVFINAMEGEMLATQHLIDVGCTKIAFVGGPKNGAAAEKVLGFETAMRKNNMEIDPDLCYFEYNHFTTGFWAVRDFISKNKVPDGIVCALDDIAMGCLKYLLKNGYKVPDDVKVIGFNGIPHIHTYEPSISSLRQPIEETAKEVMRLLHNRILHPFAAKQQIILQTTLIVNNSTDPFAPSRFSIG